MGWCCRRGFGTPQSDAEAVGWYEKAAALGHVAAKRELDEALPAARVV